MLTANSPAAFAASSFTFEQWSEADGEARRFDAVLLEFPLPPHVDRSRLFAPEAVQTLPPLVVIDRTGDGAAGIEAVQAGAQDWLVRSALTPALLGRSLQYAIERHRLLRELHDHAAELRKVVEMNADGMLVLDENGCILFANPRVGELLGRRSGELQNEHFGIPLAGETPVEVTLRSADGIERTAEIRATNIDWDGKPALLASLRDITERKAVEARLRQYHRRLSALASELSRAEQRQRRHFAEVLHDGLQQVLVAIKMNLQAVRPQLSNTPAAGSIGYVDSLVDEAVATSRALVAEMSPSVLYDAGLLAALRWLGRSMSERHGLVVKIEGDASCVVQDLDLRVFLFHSVRELLQNIVRHASGSPARVWLSETGGRLTIVVEDEGPGYSSDILELGAVDNQGFGLFSIQQRLEFWDGTLTLSNAQRGSRAVIEVPLERAKQDSDDASE